MKVADVVKFVLTNRKNKVCRDWSPYEITQSVGRALNNSTIAYTTDKDGNLNGIVWGSPDFVNKILHIETILSTTDGVLRKLMLHFLDIYDGWTLTADRRGRFVKYNTAKLKKIYGR